MNLLTTLILLLSLWTSLLIAAPVASPRRKYNFNSDWRVLVDDATDAEAPDFDDSDWKRVTLPYAWNEDDAFKLDIANLSTGIAWYRKHFNIPAELSQKKIFLEFEGIRHGGEFYLNGKWIGRSENGVMAFGFDVSDEIVPQQDNVLAARIDNSWDYEEVSTGTTFQWNDRNFYANYGGINKNVYLHATDKLHQTLPLYSNLKTTGVYVYAQEIDISARSAKITAEAQVRNEYTNSKTFRYDVAIADTQGNEIAQFEGDEHTIHPNQTSMVSATELVNDLEFWSWGYGYLYDVHTTLTIDGRVVDSVVTRTGFRKTSFENGMVTLNDRALHVKGYAQRTTNEWPALGCAVPPFLSEFSNRQVLDGHGALIRWMHVTPWKQDVESMDRLGLIHAMPAGDSEGDASGRQWEQRVELMRDAIIYNRNNPSILFYEGGNHGISEDHMTQLKNLRDTYDPHGGRASGSREMLDSDVAEYGGEMLYINKNAYMPVWQMEYSRDEGVRKYWDNWTAPYHPDGDGPLYEGEEAPEYNHNQDTMAVEDVVRWYDYYQMRPGTGKRVNAGGVNIIFSDSNTHHRGSQNYRTSGEVDALRIPKDAWYAHQVMWNNWVDIEKPALHIVGHWNYNASTEKPVYVVSTADDVELFLNGESLGKGIQSKRFLFTFSNVAWQAGELKAVGYDASGSTVVSDTKATAGEPVEIRLKKYESPTGWQADGNDIAIVEVEAVDAEGQRNPTALNSIEFSLAGEATWRGGIAVGADNYILSQTLPVENGVNRVLLRSTTKAGSVSLEASSNGLKSASITLSTTAFQSVDGLSTELPGTGFPINLSRGPTPQGQSYSMKRRTLTIANATAGSATDDVANSYDDNEYSTWTSSSADGAAWIEYTLGEPATVNQLVMKMRSFRTTSYPVEVSADGKVIYNGTTPMTLGYVTLDLDPTTTDNVRIALDDSTGTLGIIEAELYAPL